MKRLLLNTLKSIPFVALLAFFNPVNAQNISTSDTLLTPAQWIEFNENIVEAIHSDNPGVNEGALRMIIRYGHSLNLDRDTAFNIMRIYRDDDSEATRRMAVLALGNMEDRWAVEFLDMLAPFEESESIKKTMNDVVAAYWESHGGNPYR